MSVAEICGPGIAKHMVDKGFHTIKQYDIFYKNKGSLELIILIRWRNSNIAGKMQMFTKQISLHRISKAHYVLLF